MPLWGVLHLNLGDQYEIYLAQWKMLPQILSQLKERNNFIGGGCQRNFLELVVSESNLKLGLASLEAAE